MPSETAVTSDVGQSGQTPETREFRPLPGELDSPQAKLVYLYVHASGRADVEELSRALGLEQLSLYPILRVLTSYNLLEKRDGTFVDAG